MVTKISRKSKVESRKSKVESRKSKALKRRSKLLFLCLLSSTLWQCQKEELEKIEPQSTPNLKIWVVPGEQVFNESEVVKQKVNSLNNENTALRLTSETYNFSIDETKVQMIIGNDYTQYTFKVDRPMVTRNLLENYICKVFNDGGIIQYLVSYPFTENENGIIYDNHGSLVKVIDDDNLLGNIQGYSFPIGCEPELISVSWSYQCTNYPCTGAGHAYGEHGCHCNGSNCEPAYQVCQWVPVHFYGCGGGGSGGSPGNGGGGGIGSTPLGVDQLLTVPFDSAIDQELPPDPCSQLNKLKNSPDFTHAINDLKLKAMDNKEHAWVYKYFPETTSIAPPTAAGHNTEDPHVVDLAAFNDIEWFGAFHNHTNGNKPSIKMFSAYDDIKWLFNKARKKAKYCQNNNLQIDVSDIFLGLVNVSEVYCLKIKDWDKFSVISPKFNEFDKKLKTAYFKIGTEGTQAQLQKALLKLLNEYEIGIGLYILNQDGNWEEINLNPINENNNPIKTPCN